MFSDPAQSSVRPARIAVIGGGITGLAAAHRLLSRTDQVHVTIFEASSRLGGIIRTEEADGFLMELGPDSFITNKPAGLELCREIGFSEQLVATESQYRRSFVLRKGKPLAVPEGFQLMIPSNVWSVMKSPVLSLSGRLRLLAEYFVPGRASDDDESLTSFVSRRFGREVFERLVQPLVGGIYTADPDKLSINATLPRFPEMEQSHGSIIRASLARRRSVSTESAEYDEAATSSGARYGLFTTAAHGLGSLIAAAEQWLTRSKRARFQMGCEVSEIVPATDVARLRKTARNGAAGELAGTQLSEDNEPAWTLNLRSSSAEPFDAVIVALPAYTAAGLMRRPAMSDLSATLNEIEYASSAIVLSGHHLSDFTHAMDAFGLVVPAIERRKILAVSFSSRKFADRAPDGQVLLRTFMGGAMQPELMQQDNDALTAIVDDELRTIFGMSAAPMFSEVVRYNRAMPQYHVGHLDRVAKIEALQSKFFGLQLAGNAYHGVGIPDSIFSGRTAADKILAAVFH